MNKKIKQFELKLEDLEDMKSEDCVFIPESDYGLAEIYFKNNKFELFSILMYGGEPRLEMVDSNAMSILLRLQSWS